MPGCVTGKMSRLVPSHMRTFINVNTEKDVTDWKVEREALIEGLLKVCM